MSISKMNKLGLDNKNLISRAKNLYDDTTEYGEFVSTFHSWMTMEEQKRNAEYLANIEKINKENEELNRLTIDDCDI